MGDEAHPKGESRPSTKRKASNAALNDKSRRPIKRRASKACQCCRSRKVRCNVVEHGAPCTNCRLDEVECIVTESKRKRKSLPKSHDQLGRAFANPAPEVERRNSNNILDSLSNLTRLPAQHEVNEHIPHSLYRTHSDNVSARDVYSRPPLNTSASAPAQGGPSISTPTDTNRSLTSGSDGRNLASSTLPSYFKPLPPRLGQDEREYLERKSALAIPDDELRNELLRCYIEFVHPLMPLLELREFLHIIEKGTGAGGRISLLLFHAVMFASSAFVDMVYLRRAGYVTRKEARKNFFQKVRVLYDMDYEIDRFSVVQALLLLTSWDETPDDRKDTWHWAGIAISTAIAIGIHRDPSRSVMELQKKRQWKRVWWACVVRDRQIALGMRRVARLRPDDFDVPMLTMDDFEIQALPSEITCISDDCRIARDVNMQRSMATVCIEQTKLSVCLGKVLSTQYTLAHTHSADGDEFSDNACYEDLQNWYGHLPYDAHFTESNQPDTIARKDAPLVLNKALLHMIYFATLGSLQRPQSPFGPQASSLSAWKAPNAPTSRDIVRQSASQITYLATFLLMHDLVRFLPTIAVTVVQPAITNHLSEIKSDDEETRKKSLQGFCQCIQVMNRLRDCYPAADHSVNLVEAAIRRADIPVNTPGSTVTNDDDPQQRRERATCVEDLVGAGIRQKLVLPVPPSRAMTPPPDETDSSSASDEEGSHVQLPPDTTAFSSTWLTDPLARKFESFIGSTPPVSTEEGRPAMDYISHIPNQPYSLGITPGGLLDQDFESFVNMEHIGERFQLDPSNAILAAASGVGDPSANLGIAYQQPAPRTDSHRLSLAQTGGPPAMSAAGMALAPAVDATPPSSAASPKMDSQGKGMTGVQVAA